MNTTDIICGLRDVYKYLEDEEKVRGVNFGDPKFTDIVGAAMDKLEQQQKYRKKYRRFKRKYLELREILREFATTDTEVRIEGIENIRSNARRSEPNLVTGENVTYDVEYTEESSHGISNSSDKGFISNRDETAVRPNNLVNSPLKQAMTRGLNSEAKKNE